MDPRRLFRVEEQQQIIWWPCGAKVGGNVYGHRRFGALPPGDQGKAQAVV